MLNILKQLKKALGEPAHSPDNNGDVLFHCPNCDHRKPHLSVNLKRELYHCWVCDFAGRGHKKCLQRLGFHEQAKQFSDGNYYHTHELTKENLRMLLEGGREINAKVITMPKEYKFLYLKRKNPLYGSAIKYLKNRMIDEDDMLKYNLHFSLEHLRILFPSYDNNYKLNYYVSRSINNNAYIKYNNPDIPKSDFIFNEHLIKWNERLLLVEGIFDSILSRMNSVPVLGSSLNRKSKLYKKIIENETPVILAFDQDAYIKQINVASLLYNSGIDVEFVDMRNIEEDIANVGPKKFNIYMFDNIITYDIDFEIKNKMEIL